MPRAMSPYYRVMRRLIYPPFVRKLARVEGAEHLPSSGGFIVAMNHVDWLDGFYLAAAVDRERDRPIYFLTASKNYWWTTLTLPIPTQRESIIATAVDHLRHGRAIVNFPEGMRNPRSQLLLGKTGTVRMAAQADVPVVPVGITCEAGGSMAQSLQHLLSRRFPVTLRFGPVLRFSAGNDDHDGPALHAATARLMAAIAPLAGKTI